MKIAVEMGGNGLNYGKVHKAGCGDLRDAEPLGEANSIAEAEALMEDVTGWEAPYQYAPCVKF